MAIKRHTSAKGKEINFDQLQHHNEKALAVGNAGINARGDKIGQGGKILETAEQRAAAQTVDPNAAYNQNNPKAVKMVSIKDNIDNMAAVYNDASLTTTLNADDAKTPLEVIQEVDDKAKNKRKIVDKED